MDSTEVLEVAFVGMVPLRVEESSTTIGFSISPLISIETLPVDTNLDLANIITKTSIRIIPLNDATPKIKSIFIFKVKFLQMT